MIISSGATWKMKRTPNNANWYKSPYHELTSYEIGGLGNAPEFTDATVYLATEFNPVNIDEYAAFKMSITHKMGFILYLNGIELYRKFINDTVDVKYTTLSNDELDQAADIELILPSIRFVSGRNTLSIEVHRKALTTATNKLQFSAYASKIDELEDGCLMISKPPYSTVTDTYGTTPSENKAEKAADYNPSTFWSVQASISGEATRAWMILGMKPNTLGWFNQLGWRSIEGLGASDLQNQPSRMSIYGQRNGEWELLQQKRDIVVRDSSQRFVYHLMENNHIYSAFNFSIDSVSGITTGLKIADVFVGACQKYYCEAEGGFPAASSGSKITAPCKPGLVGSMVRECGSGKNPTWGEADTSRCRVSPPTNLEYPYNSYDLVTYQPLAERILPTVAFLGELVYDIRPKPIPDGLLFNNKTGEITEMPISRRNRTEYFVTATDLESATGVEAVITIGVTASFCQAIDKYQATEGGDIVHILCDTGFTGSKSRRCIDGPTPRWGDEINECKDNRSLSTANIVLISVFSVLGVVALVAIGLCCYGRVKATKRKTKRAAAGSKGPTQGGLSVRDTGSKRSQKSVRL